MFPLFMKRGFSIPPPPPISHFGILAQKSIWMKLLFAVLTSSWKRWQSNKRKRSSLCVSGYFQLPFSAALQGTEPALRSVPCHWWHIGQSRERSTGRLWVQLLCHWGGEEYVAALSHVGDKQELEGHTALGMGTGNSCVTWMCFPTCLRCWRQLPGLCRAPANSGKGLFCYVI